MRWILYVISRSFSLAIILSASLTACFWPAPYQVHLHHGENFEFMVEFEQSDEEMEMLKADDINYHNLNVDDSKLERLHKHFENNKNYDGDIVAQRSSSAFNRPSSNDYKNDETVQLWGNNSNWIPLPPYYGKIVVHKVHVEKSRAVNISNPDATEITTANKLSGLSDEIYPEYDYNLFKQEYYSEAKDEFQSNQTYNYTNEGKPEDTLKDSFETIIDMKKPKNCSKEEATNFGLQAVECLADDYEHAQSKEVKTKLAWKVVKIICIWSLIGCVVISILWCKFGWCCCCCICCSLCRPREIIFEAKRYVTNNPPGVLLLPDGTTRSFEPSVYEVEAYDTLLQYSREL